MNKSSGASTEKRKDLIFYICFMAIPIVQFAFFYIAVNFQSILLAFQSLDAATNTTSWVGFDNIKQVLVNFTTQADMISSLKNSLIMFLIRIGIGTPLGLFFSFYIYKKFFASGFFRVILFLPSIISAIVMVTIFQFVADRALPTIIQTVFGVENVNGLLATRDTAFGTVMFYNIWISFGTTVLLYVDAMKNISQDVVEAGEIDGATGIKEYVFITLPSVYKTIITFIIINIANFFIDQANLYSFYGRMIDNSMMTVGYYLYKETYWATIHGFYYQYNYLAAMGIVFTLITIPVTLVTRFLLNKYGPKED